MQDEHTKLRVKLGPAEIEYEGGTDFLKAEVMPTIGKMLQMVNTQADLRKPPPMLPANDEPIDVEVAEQLPKLAKLTSSTLAAMLSAESATDLAIVASARLILFGEQDPVGRRQILDEMQSVTAYFKKTYINNHSNTLKALVKADRLRLVAHDAYSLSPKERKAIEAAIKKADEDDAG